MAVSSTSQDKRKRRDVHKCSDDCVIFTMEQFAVLTNVQVKSMEYPTWKFITEQNKLRQDAPRMISAAFGRIYELRDREGEMKEGRKE